MAQLRETTINNQILLHDTANDEYTRLRACYGGIDIGYNTLSSGSSLTFGWDNEASNTGSQFNIIFGANNKVKYGECLISGRDNQALLRNQYIFGEGVIAASEYSLSVGKYPEIKYNTVFNIGTGTSDSARKTVFSIGNDGHINSTAGVSFANEKFQINDNGVMSKGEIPQGYLGWGGKNWVASVSPIGCALSSEHSANRLAFINPNAIKIESSTDGGATWTIPPYSDSLKVALVTTQMGCDVGYGATTATTNCKVRITITGQDGTTTYVYTHPRKLLINLSSAAHAMKLLVEKKTGETNASWSSSGEYSVAGWSGWNDIPLTDMNTFGGSTNQTGNYWYMRLTFSLTSINSSYTTSIPQILSLRLFGDSAWSTPSTMASIGHLYSYDWQQNAIFPASVYITKDINITTADDQYGIFPSQNNYNTIGKSGLQWYQVHAKQIYENGTALESKYSQTGHNHDSSYVLKSGDTMTGPLKLKESGNSPLLFRHSNNEYLSGISYKTNGNEAMCFENKNAVTSFIFRTANPDNESTAWDNAVPSMQIKNQRVTINKFIANETDAAYNLDVNGTINGTTLYENGSLLSDKYAPKSHTHSKSEVGLGNVDNTADADKTVAKAKVVIDSQNGTPINISYNHSGLNYNTTPWLAAWDGYNLYSISRDVFAKNDHDHISLKANTDNRETATKPEDYRNLFKLAGLKTSTVINSPSNDTYSSVIGFSTWSDTSGGYAHEFAINDSGLYHRIESASTVNTWNSWERFAMASELSNYIVNSSDGLSTAINKLSVGTDTPSDNDYYISQYANGGTTTTSYHRRSMSALWSYIKGKIGSSKGSATQPVYIDSNGVATPCTYSLNKTVPSGALFTDEKVKITTNNSSQDPLAILYTNSLTLDSGGPYTSIVAKNSKLTYVPSTGQLRIGDGNTTNASQTGSALIGGNLQITAKNDNYGLMPSTNNYNQIGSASLYWYRSYITNGNFKTVTIENSPAVDKEAANKGYVDTTVNQAITNNQKYVIIDNKKYTLSFSNGVLTYTPV